MNNTNCSETLSWVTDFDDAPVTRYDIVAVSPGALDAIALGGDEFEILCALTEINSKGLAALNAF